MGLNEKTKMVLDQEHKHKAKRKSVLKCLFYFGFGAEFFNLIFTLLVVFFGYGKGKVSFKEQILFYTSHRNFLHFFFSSLVIKQNFDLLEKKNEIFLFCKKYGVEWYRINFFFNQSVLFV